MATLAERYLECARIHDHIHQLLFTSAMRLYKQGESPLAEQVYHRAQAELIVARSYADKARRTHEQESPKVGGGTKDNRSPEPDKGTDI